VRHNRAWHELAAKKKPLPCGRGFQVEDSRHPKQSRNTDLHEFHIGGPWSPKLLAEISFDGTILIASLCK
jgi:hypothetical protein